MGIDLVPKQELDERLYEASKYNWSEWRYISSVLEQLGVDTSELSGSNDGDEVSRETAWVWGCAIREAMSGGRIIQGMVSDETYISGFRREPLVLAEDASHDSPEIMVELIAGTVSRLDADTREWLDGCARFFEESGGFAQC